MLCTPGDNVLRLSVARLLISRATLPRVAVPSLKVMLPVGVGPERLLTCAVSVKVSPTVTVALLLPSVMDVEAWPTASLTVLETPFA